MIDLAPRVLLGDNPFGVAPEADLLHEPPAGVPGWSETMYFHVWSPDDGVGVFIHCGRWPDDLDLWWAQVIVMLPDGELLVDRSWGRAVDNRGPATGNLRIECVEPLKRWRLTFDGAGEITELARMADGPSGAGPARAFGFDIEIEAAAPVWDMHGALGLEGLSWAAFHHTQGFLGVGSIRAGAETWGVRGVAHRDHSSGPRDVARLGGLHFCVLVFPETGRVINGLVNWDIDDVVDHRTAAIQQDGRCEVTSSIRLVGLSDPRTQEPRQFTIRLEGEGASLDLDAQWLHGYALSFLAPNENLNGVDLRAQPDALIISQSTGRVIDRDGAVGYGVVERDYRPSRLPSPEER